MNNLAFHKGKGSDFLLDFPLIFYWLYSLKIVSLQRKKWNNLMPNQEKKVSFFEWLSQCVTPITYLKGNFFKKNFLITIKYTNFAIPKNIVSFYENLI